MTGCIRVVVWTNEIAQFAPIIPSQAQGRPMGFGCAGCDSAQDAAGASGESETASVSGKVEPPARRNTFSDRTTVHHLRCVADATAVVRNFRSTEWSTEFAGADSDPLLQ